LAAIGAAAAILGAQARSNFLGQIAMIAFIAGALAALLTPIAACAWAIGVSSNPIRRGELIHSVALLLVGWAVDAAVVVGSFAMSALAALSLNGS
jgi:hypothetical protein